MFNKEHIVIMAKTRGTFEAMCNDILSRIDAKRVLKISFFDLPADNQEYLHVNRELRRMVKACFGEKAPLVSFIAQKSTSPTLLAEVTYLVDEDATIAHRANYIILQRGTAKELITEGIIPHDLSASTFEQANDIFATIDNILTSEGFKASDIYRQWNYIEGITITDNGSQNYQEFNDARSIFYSKTKWSNGYPAATGIGTARGGTMIELYAIKGAMAVNKPIDNPMQVAAHSYSQNVLKGKVMNELHERTTPKFERARILGSTIYISGTAAIKGEASSDAGSTASQAELTMQIMDNLISQKNIPTPSNGAVYDLLRIYVKHEDAIPEVRLYMDTHYPATPKHYLVSDICRPELLIEIEGIAHTL